MTFGTYGFMASYLNTYMQMPLNITSLIITFALAVDALLEPFIALLADKIGYLKIIIPGVLGMMLFSIPIFYLLSSGDIFLTTIGLTSMSILIAVIYAPLNAYMVTLFPKQYRYSGFGISFHIGISLFGATAPLVMIWLIEKTGNIMSPALYYIFGSFIGLVALAICEMGRRKGVM